MNKYESLLGFTQFEALDWGSSFIVIVFLLLYTFLCLHLNDDCGLLFISHAFVSLWPSSLIVRNFSSQSALCGPKEECPTMVHWPFNIFSSARLLISDTGHETQRPRPGQDLPWRPGGRHLEWAGKIDDVCVCVFSLFQFYLLITSSSGH